MLSSAEIAERYAYPPHLESPWFRMNFVSSIDGAAQDASGLSGGLGGPDDTAIFAVLRSLADVIIVGAGTARTEGYAPVRPSEIHAEIRSQFTDTTVPPIAIVSRQLDIPDSLITPGHIVITCGNSDPNKRAKLVETVDVIVTGHKEIDWPATATELAQRGLYRVLCEGGPHLHGDLIAADQVDELCLSVATVLTGGESRRIAIGPIAPSRAMRLVDTIAGRDLLATRWIRDRKITAK